MIYTVGCWRRAVGGGRLRHETIISDMIKVYGATAIFSHQPHYCRTCLRFSYPFSRPKVFCRTVFIVSKYSYSKIVHTVKEFTPFDVCNYWIPLTLSFDVACAKYIVTAVSTNDIVDIVHDAIGADAATAAVDYTARTAPSVASTHHPVNTVTTATTGKVILDYCKITYKSRHRWRVPLGKYIWFAWFVSCKQSSNLIHTQTSTYAITCDWLCLIKTHLEDLRR